jgi:PqqD family protein of HPr-rel-A system
MRYSRPLGPALIEQRFQEMTVVFDSSTGQTHFLSDLPLLLLSSLDAEPLDFEDIVDRLAGGSKIERDAVDHIRIALEDLRRAELIVSD